MCCCTTCSSHLTNCPLCRKRIEQAVKTFRHWVNAVQIEGQRFLPVQWLCHLELRSSLSRLQLWRPEPIFNAHDLESLCVRAQFEVLCNCKLEYQGNPSCKSARFIATNSHVRRTWSWIPCFVALKALSHLPPESWCSVSVKVALCRGVCQLQNHASPECVISQCTWYSKRCNNSN